jgi:hypothetical protein
MFWEVDMLVLPTLIRHTFEKADSLVWKSFFEIASRDAIVYE